MSDNQPRSIRLTKEHRSDMVRAVMQEWVKQHPKPTASVSFHAAVADQVKLSVQYKRTARVVPVLQPGDEKCLKVNECVLITITDSEGNHRNSLQIEYPPVLADRLGLVGIDLEQDEYTFSMDRQGQIDGTLPDAYRGLTTSDIVDGSTRVVESDTGREARVRSRRWVGERIVVQISDDSNAYKAYQAARKAQNEWEGEAHRLRRRPPTCWTSSTPPSKSGMDGRRWCRISPAHCGP